MTTNFTREWITPDWPAPANVKAISTTRYGGASMGPFHSMNLGDHVGDDPAVVQVNRLFVEKALLLPSAPRWLKQVHGTTVVDAAEDDPGVEADGSFSSRPGTVCAVMTADCLPLLLCDRTGTRVAALHAGWRGLANGIVEAGVKALVIPGTELMAWLGPAIGPAAFEVGEEVRQAFVARDPRAAGAFTQAGGGKWLADIYRLAHLRLAALGVEQVYGGGFCTYTDSARFFSYRRDGVTGRMATLIWLDAAP